MTNTGHFLRFIVEKDRRYVRSGNGIGNGDEWTPDWTPHVWDAKEFESLDKAWKLAKKIGGRARVFDKLNGRFSV